MAQITECGNSAAAGLAGELNKQGNTDLKGRFMRYRLMRATDILKPSRGLYGRGAGYLSRQARIAAAAIAVVTGAVLVAAPQARADGGLGTAPITAFQANTTALWFTGQGVTGGFDTGLGMAPGTNPAIAVLGGTTHEAAFQANTGILWFGGTQGNVDTGLGMAAGTSPSIAGTPHSQWVAAFQANTGILWVDGPGIGAIDTGLGMAPGTSPSVSYQSATGRYQVAFQANTGHLWFEGPGIGAVDTGLAMAPGTSPSITAVGSGFETAYQSSSGILGATGIDGTSLTGLGMGAGTSPSITTVSGGGGLLNYQIAFQANTSALWTTGGFGTIDTGLGMAAGTSPSITGLIFVDTTDGGGTFDADGYHIAFQANTGTLYSYDHHVEIQNGRTFDSSLNTGFGMDPGSSPSTTSTS
jgi:hypothetical protein